MQIKLFKILMLCAVLLNIGNPAMAKTEEKTDAGNTKHAHHVVIELVSGDPKEWEKLMNNSENLIKALGDGTTEIEIVSHGEGLKMLMKSTAEKPEERMKKLADQGVVFAACQNTMKRMNVTAGDLVKFAKPVDSGVAEVVRKQESGWSYISR